MPMRISDIFKSRLARFADAMGSRLLRPDGTSLSVPYSVEFPDFAPSILASFTASATASQSGTTVTVSATGHGIVGSAARNGYRIYYPGSPSIPAGWYSGFAWVDANTITFQRAAATVASESVNGGAALLSQVTICTYTLPGGMLGNTGRLTARFARGGNSTSGAKTIRLLLGGVMFGASGATTSPSMTAEMSVFASGATSQISTPATDGSLSSVSVLGSVDTTVDQPVVMAGQLTNSSQWLSLDWVRAEVER